MKPTEFEEEIAKVIAKAVGNDIVGDFILLYRNPTLKQVGAISNQGNITGIQLFALRWLQLSISVGPSRRDGMTVNIPDKDEEKPEEKPN